MKKVVAGVVLLVVVAIAGLLLAPRLALAAWLAAWWWVLGLVLGGFTNAWMHRLTGGTWGEPLQESALELARWMPWLLLALLPIAIGHRWLYPWALDPAAGLPHESTRPAFHDAWLSTPFFVVRLVVYAVAWWWLASARSLAGKGRAAGSLVLYMFVTSLAATDLLMSLVPQWYSTAFGLIVMSVQALSGSAFAVLLAARRGARAGVPPPPWRDLGNLLLMWVMSWGYLAFMQFLIIWAENLPREIAWYVPRLQTGWVTVGVVLVIVQLALPFVALLFRAVKDHPHRLAWVAVLLLAATALDTAWTVMPSVDAHALHAWWLLPGTFAGAALLVLAPLLQRASRRQEAKHAQ
jgi:hypothetical protein